MASTSAAAAAPLPLLRPPRLAGIYRRAFKSNSFAPLRSPVSASLSSSSPSDPPSAAAWEREEARWLREEQRWLREEKRWLREESRWRAEREALLRDISALRLRVEELERGRPSLEAVVVAPAPQRKSNVGRIAAARARPVLVEEAQVKEMILEEVRVSESVVEEKGEEEKKKESRCRTLRMGSEGDDVRAMQVLEQKQLLIVPANPKYMWIFKMLVNIRDVRDCLLVPEMLADTEALQRLGFYSGEEDMEFSAFSSGTERAVKTWQASLGTREDGIMTTELLERLFMEQTDGTNGAAVASLTEITEVQQKVVKENGDAEVEVSQRRVFLLGENRWEEPSRLVGRDKSIERSKAVSATKCLSCRGEGKIMCTECDGTGEPNIEPQFLEWVDEGTKCPYCEGLGYTICDVCEGRTTVEA